MIRWLFVLIVLLVLGTVAAFGGWLYWFTHTPISLPATPFEFSIKHGSSLRSTARQISASGLPLVAWQFELMARALRQDRDLKAGNYELTEPVTPLELLTKLRVGDALQSEITFIEGHTFSQMRRTLTAHGGLKQDSAGLGEEAILKLIGANESNPEGLFFPDTYVFSGGISDIAVLKRAYQSMQSHLAKAWDTRAPKLPYAKPYEALIMASIVEKETGKADERPRIAAVFVNRLKRGMKLQTDPTVIYGMGDRYTGNIHKRDLTTDTPYNTYTRGGLPPTPIAMPGMASIDATLRPAATDDLYFVAKGDGSHYFSKSLDEHNRAVDIYQR